MKKICFSCFTPYHLLVSAHYAIKLVDAETVLIWQDSTIDGVDITYFSRFFSKTIINPVSVKSRTRKLVDLALYGGFLFPFSYTYHYFKSNNDNIVYCYFSDEDYITQKHIRLLKKHNNNIFVLIDEGVGIYRKYETHQPLKHKIPLVLIGTHTCKYIGESQFADYVLARHPEMLDNNRFGIAKINKQSDFLKNEELIQVIKSSLGNDNHYFTDKPIVLILGNPCKEMGIDQKLYFNILQHLINTLKLDYTIIIKKHPRESIVPYLQLKDALIINDNFLNTLPVEIIAVLLNIKIVMTDFSTAAHNIYDAIGDVKILYFYKLYKNVLFDDSIYRSYFNEPNIYSIDNIEVIQSILNRNIIYREIQENTLADLELIKSLME